MQKMLTVSGYWLSVYIFEYISQYTYIYMHSNIPYCLKYSFKKLSVSGVGVKCIKLNLSVCVLD